MNHAQAQAADGLAQADPGSKSEEFDRIIYHITHDVRSTLRALKSLPGWLREDLTGSGAAPSTSVMEILEMIESQADRADRILLDLRTYSRIGRLHDAPSVVALEEAVMDAARRAGVPKSFRLDLDLRVDSVMVPRNEWRELMVALISNAVKHHDRKDGEIRIRAASDGDLIRITVDDDGPGIPEQFRERVFDMMSTLRARDECPGSGMGLAIARKVVQRLGGAIRAGGTDTGEGTRITLELPAKLAAPATVL